MDGSMPIATCHFCNTESRLVPSLDDDTANPLTASKSPFPQAGSASGSQYAISTGTPSDWLCSECTCWNHRNDREPGGIASWNEAMADNTESNNITDIHGECASREPKRVV